MNTRIALVVALVASAAGLPIAGSAQVKPGATAADVALYTGADRLQKLVEGAKKEGTVSIYTSAQTTDFNLLSAAYASSMRDVRPRLASASVNHWRIRGDSSA